MLGYTSTERVCCRELGLLAVVAVTNITAWIRENESLQNGWSDCQRLRTQGMDVLRYTGTEHVIE